MVLVCRFECILKTQWFSTLFSLPLWWFNFILNNNNNHQKTEMKPTQDILLDIMWDWFFLQWNQKVSKINFCRLFVFFIMLFNDLAIDFKSHYRVHLILKNWFGIYLIMKTQFKFNCFDDWKYFFSFCKVLLILNMSIPQTFQKYFFLEERWRFLSHFFGKIVRQMLFCFCFNFCTCDLPIKFNLLNII